VAVARVDSDVDFSPRPGARELRVLHADAHVLVVEKPPHVATHPLRPDESDTLVNDLVRDFPDVAGVGYSKREPGILHRLDRGTSGVVLVARTAPAFEALREALRAGAIEKRYLALAAGALERGRLECFLAPDPRSKKRVRATGSPAKGARHVITEIASVEPIGAFTLAGIVVNAAYRHQIRAHLAFERHPLAGDALYRGPSLDGLTRHFLHAVSIAFDHPQTHERIAIESPLAADLAGVLVRMGRAGPPGR
jgi:23S rRNA pseudouridine1911/1915/1917 synthase